MVLTATLFCCSLIVSTSLQSASADAKSAMRELYVRKESHGAHRYMGTFPLTPGVADKWHAVVDSRNTLASQRRVARGAVATLLSSIGYRGIGEAVYNDGGTFHHDPYWVDSAFIKDSSLIFCKSFYGLPSDGLLLETRDDLRTKVESRYRADFSHFPGIEALLASNRYEDFLTLYAFFIEGRDGEFDEIMVYAVADEAYNLPPELYLDSLVREGLAQKTGRAAEAHTTKRGRTQRDTGRQAASARKIELEREGHVHITNTSARRLLNGIKRRRRG